MLHRLYFTCGNSDPCLYVRKEKSEFVIIALFVDDLILKSNSSDLSKVKSCTQRKLQNDWSRWTVLVPWDTGCTMSRQCTTNSKDLNSQDAWEIRHARLQTLQHSCSCSFQERLPFRGRKFIWGGYSKISEHYCFCFERTLEVCIETWQESSSCCWKVCKIPSIFKRLSSRVFSRKATEKFSLNGYCDASWGCQEGYSSITGFVFKVLTGPFSWCAKKQLTIALSTAEAKYVALSHAVQEAIWLRH